MKRTIALAATLLLAAPTVLLTPQAASAVTASGTDPTGDTLAEGTKDIARLDVELTESVVRIDITVAQSLPPLTDPTWSDDIFDSTGRGFRVSFGQEFGPTSIQVHRDGATLENADGSFNHGSPPSVAISNKTLTITADATCAGLPGVLHVTAQNTPEDKGNNSFDTRYLDVAVAPEFNDPDFESKIDPVVVALNDGGYYQLGADGGAFSFGGAAFFCSTGNLQLNQPVVGMQAQPNNDGYRFVARDGGVFAYGSAQFHGSCINVFETDVVALSFNRAGTGYYLTDEAGYVQNFGGAYGFGSIEGYNSFLASKFNAPVVGFAVK